MGEGEAMADPIWLQHRVALDRIKLGSPVRTASAATERLMRGVPAAFPYSPVFLSVALSTIACGQCPTLPHTFTLPPPFPPKK